MPKERFHMLLAEESFALLETYWGSLPFDETCRFARLLGSMIPDTLFYDVPFFTLSRIGNELHRFEGEAGLPFFSSWLEEAKRNRQPELHAWILGVTVHFLADGFWHPLITKMSECPFLLCRDLQLSPGNCHLWLESEIEGHWLGLLRPRGGYGDVLKAVQRDARRLGKYIDFFRDLMIRAGLKKIPTVGEIARCLFWQAFLLRQFAHSRWGKWRGWLLSMRKTRYFGALIVPVRPILPQYLISVSRRNLTVENPCDMKFLATAVTYLAARLSGLPVRF